MIDIMIIETRTAQTQVDAKTDEEAIIMGKRMWEEDRTDGLVWDCSCTARIVDSE